MDCEEYNKWYPYFEFPDRYEINKNGQVRNVITKHILNGSIRKSDGYLYYGLKDNHGKTVSRSAHRMVAEQFIPKVRGKIIINHIDEDRGNPCVDNLEWVTPSENSRHGTCQKRKAEKILKPVNEYNQAGEYVRTWKSIKHLIEFVEGKEIQDTRKNKAYNRARAIIEKNTKDYRKRLKYGRIFIFSPNNVITNLYDFDLVADRGNQIDRNIILSDDDSVPSKYLCINE